MLLSHSHAVVTLEHGAQDISEHIILLCIVLGSRWLVQRQRVHGSFSNSLPGCKQENVHVRKHRNVTGFTDRQDGRFFFIQRERKEKLCLTMYSVSSWTQTFFGTEQQRKDEGMRIKVVSVVSCSLTGQTGLYAQNLPHLNTGQHFVSLMLISKPGLQTSGCGHFKFLHTDRENSEKDY